MSSSGSAPVCRGIEVNRRTSIETKPACRPRLDRRTTAWRARHYPSTSAPRDAGSGRRGDRRGGGSTPELRRLVCYTGAVTDPYFQSVGPGVLPLPHAHPRRGATTCCTAGCSADWRPGRSKPSTARRVRAARLTVDLFRPATMALVEIEVRPIRAGRRIRVTDALMRCDGHDVGHTTAVSSPRARNRPADLATSPRAVARSRLDRPVLGRPLGRRRLVVPERAWRVRHR